MRPVISEETVGLLREVAQKERRGSPVSADDLDTEQHVRILLEASSHTARIDRDGEEGEPEMQIWDGIN